MTVRYAGSAYAVIPAPKVTKNPISVPFAVGRFLYQWSRDPYKISLGKGVKDSRGGGEELKRELPEDSSPAEGRSRITYGNNPFGFYLGIVV